MKRGLATATAMGMEMSPGLAVTFAILPMARRMAIPLGGGLALGSGNLDGTGSAADCHAIGWAGGRGDGTGVGLGYG